MNHSRLAATAPIALTLALGASASGAHADTLLSDKTSAVYDIGFLSNIFTHLNACGCGPTDSAGIVDSFTLSSKSRLTSINAALVAIQQNPVSTFTGFGDAHGYQVNIYSSQAKAVAGLTGDVYSLTLAPGAVSFGSALNLDPNIANFEPLVGSTLATLPVDKILGPGVYYLSVIGIDDPDQNESIGVGMGGSGTAFLTNPGGDFGLPGNRLDTGENAGYAVFGVAGVPEPATWAVMIVGMGLAGAALRRRNVRLTAA